MNNMLMLYLKEHHRLLQILDALLDLASTITEDINEQHKLELVLDTARADESTQAKG